VLSIQSNNEGPPLVFHQKLRSFMLPDFKKGQEGESHSQSNEPQVDLKRAIRVISLFMIDYLLRSNLILDNYYFR